MRAHAECAVSANTFEKFISNYIISLHKKKAGHVEPAFYIERHTIFEVPVTMFHRYHQSINRRFDNDERNIVRPHFSLSIHLLSNF